MPLDECRHQLRKAIYRHMTSHDAFIDGDFANFAGRIATAALQGTNDKVGYSTANSNVDNQNCRNLPGREAAIDDGVKLPADESQSQDELQYS
ncbi:hypothetical protein WR25_08825 [Diploscapter pachys]|uniref:Uncharacterized protein n=1 Tax=Diploscapter pachys TaxID=2018661 RepID=A0A2A2JAY6_9BILA|nr:hypothetical protein WR25_08825 [Diploscapter pachys]